jgi:TorA maturation chaperone TorD
MSTPSNYTEQLSRFFFAINANEMMDSYLVLASAPSVDDWSAVEFSFNRLFVGPRTLLAPPYASIYLDSDNTRLMGEATLRIRELYEMIGLTSPWLNKIPDDHIALELDALWQVETALQKVDAPQLRDVREYLLAHMQSWVPRFVSRIQSVDDVHPAILSVVEKLKAAIFSEGTMTTLKRAT